jgi:hypothetical protein
MPSLEIFDALDAPDIIEIDGGLEINVSETILGPEVIEVLQGPPGPPGPTRAGDGGKRQWVYRPQCDFNRHRRGSSPNQRRH